ncbi:glycoside hydrolase family 68 protein [Lactobacillus taiwanensis]|uniref:glycoside hydrolase family 68 protein n=1 Tax=Lactobacillus taiwanensis TaxID=508451 RepID=UPI000EBBC4E5|nr:glycoside hydrolase family 68 protein [Lactobacillus taiwanensis]MRM97960.1 LPXTG cell wall anchor domain-containing protein [Lactobacillus taiwanensis]
MLENKNHKKISLSGKSLLMGTLSTAAIVLSASTANAATTNADNVDNVNVSQVTTINAPASVTKNDNSELKEDTTNKKVARTETNTSLNSSKEINSQVNESKEDSSSAQVGGAPVSTDNDKEENSSDLNQDSNNISDHFKDNDAQGQSSNSSAKTELKGKIKEVINNSGVDVTKLTNDQINNLNKVNFDDEPQDGTKLTLNDLDAIGQALVRRDPRYAVPYFNAKEIKNMDAGVTKDAQTGKTETLEIWDSWPVQDPITGYVSNYKGYQLVVAMMGMPKKNDNHIYLLYNKYNDNEFSHWKNAGSIFGYNETPDLQEWSGSAIVNKDGSIQLFYTKNDTSNGKLNDQQLATANLKLNVDNNGVSIASVDNDHVIFIGDGKNYQTYDQFANGENRNRDNYTLRDPHVVEEKNGDRYLVFEANTGSNNYQSKDQIYRWANYGGNDKFNINNFLGYFDNKDDQALASVANGALGILKLSGNQNNPTVKLDDVYSPLVTSLMVSDEMERPDIVKVGNKYYLFSATRLSRGTKGEITRLANKIVGDNVAMIGFVSDSLTHGYVPLNGSGAVLTASVPANWRTATYSYYAVPIKGKDNQLLITSYMTNRGEVAGKGNNSTWAPSFILQLNPDNTTTVLAKLTNQGVWVWNGDSENKNMIGTLEKDSSNSAALDGEWGKFIDWDAINSYSLKPHQPVTPPDTPDIPDIPNTPNTPDTPHTPNTPNTPDTPRTPEVPTTPVKKTTQSELPKAGAKDGIAAAILGAVSSMLGAIGLAGISKRKRNN